MSKENKDNIVRVFPETFKQLIFDTAMRVPDMDREGIQHVLLDLVNRYEIGPTWIEMSEGKPAGGRMVLYPSYGNCRDRKAGI